MEEGEADFIINDFLGNLNSVESEEVPEKRKRICHVHWWDGWENKPKSEPEEDFEALNLQLSAILECIGDADCKKGIMEELRKRAMTDKTGKSVNDLVLTIFEMASLASGFSLNERINFASRVYKMLHAKFQIEGNERADVMSIEKEDEGEKAFGMSENENSDDLLLKIEQVEAEWTALTAVEKFQDVHVVAHPKNGETHFGDRGGQQKQSVDKSGCLSGKNDSLLSASLCMPLQKDEEFMIALEGTGCLCHEPRVMERPLNDLVFVDKCTYFLCDAVHTGGYGYGTYGMNSYGGAPPGAPAYGGAGGGYGNAPVPNSGFGNGPIGAPRSPWGNAASGGYGSQAYAANYGTNAGYGAPNSWPSFGAASGTVRQSPSGGNGYTNPNYGYGYANNDSSYNANAAAGYGRTVGRFEDQTTSPTCFAVRPPLFPPGVVSTVSTEICLLRKRREEEGVHGFVDLKAAPPNGAASSAVASTTKFGQDQERGATKTAETTEKELSSLTASKRFSPDLWSDDFKEMQQFREMIEEKTKRVLLFLMAGGMCLPYDGKTDRLAEDEGAIGMRTKINIPPVTVAEVADVINSNIPASNFESIYACHNLVLCLDLVRLAEALAMQIMNLFNDILYDTSLRGSHETGIHEGVHHAHVASVIHECSLMHVNVVRKLFGDKYFDSGLFWRRLIRSIREQNLAILRSLMGMVLL